MVVCLSLSSFCFRAKTDEFRDRLASALGVSVSELRTVDDLAREKAALDSILEEAFAVVREAAWRVLELR